MLHVARLIDQTGTYYVADLATELGPALHAGPGATAGAVPAAGLGLEPARPGWWTGAGAAGLGLTGPVEGRDLAAVLSGRSPATDRSMVLRRGAVCGYDLTFTAPKSASVLFALGSPEVAGEVLSAHAGAVEAAMGYVGRRAMAVRRGSGDERWTEPSGGVVGAAFTHGVSRALDPHLHTHVVVANLGHGPDGRWTAVDGRGLFAHAAAAGHLYGAQLRQQLAVRLGVEWTARRSGSYEVAGIDPLVLGGFSSRQAEIRSHLAAWSSHRTEADGCSVTRGGEDPRGARTVLSGAPGRPLRTPSMAGPSSDGGSRPASGVSRRASRVAWAATRDPKGPPPAPGDLVRRWERQAAALGLTAHDLGAVLGRPSRAQGGVDEHRFAAQLVVSPHATAARRDAVGAWAGALGQGAPAVDVDRCADRLAAWGDAVGVGEPRRALASVVPTPYQLRALGPRPASPRSLGVWLEAATEIAQYRSRWNVTDRDHPLGVEGSGRELAGMGVRQLADHLAVSRRLVDARRELGRSTGRDADPPHLGLGRE